MRESGKTTSPKDMESTPSQTLPTIKEILSGDSFREKENWCIKHVRMMISLSMWGIGHKANRTAREEPTIKTVIITRDLLKRDKGAATGSIYSTHTTNTKVNGKTTASTA
jgi:hypothetical protein